MFAHSKIKEYKGHKEQVHTVAWNCDGRRLASGSVDKTARVWIPHRGVSETNHELFIGKQQYLTNFISVYID